MYFRKYRLRKTWLDKCLKSCFSEDPSRDNMANGWKYCCNLNESIFTIFINHRGVNYVRKVSFIDTQNSKTVCYDLDCR